MSERNPPSWMQGGSHPAEQDRLLLAAFVASEGVVLSGDLLVSFTSGLGLSIAGGGIWIGSDSAAVPGFYHCYNDGAVTKTLANNGSGNPRKDIVVAALDDNFYDSSGFSRWRLTVIQGTPNATPADPSVPSNAIKLCSITVPSSSVINASSFVDVRPRGTLNGVSPVGSISVYAGTSTPPGFLICSGAAVSRSTYKHLFDVIGTTFGAGDGSTTFNVPDLRGRVPVGLDNMGGSDAGRLSVANTLGGTGGEQNHTLLDGEMPVHAHTVLGKSNSAAGNNSRFMHDNGTGTNDDTSTNTSGSNDPHNNMQPYQLMNYLIKV